MEENSNNSNYKENKLAGTYSILIGIVILIGIISAFLSFVMCGGILPAIIVIIVTALITLFFRTISEILQLLEDIKNK